MADYLQDLNSAQRQAVIHPGGPLLILAGAGSGKTKALTHRAAYLLDQGILPSQILLTTFTNKAAQEMQARLYHLVGQKLPFAGTFHSLCARILRLHASSLNLSPDFVIYDADDQLAAIKETLVKLKLDPQEYRPRSLLYQLEMAKHHLLSPQAYQAAARGPFQRVVAAIYHQYQHLLRQNQALDFNDLLVETVHLFETNTSILNHFQHQFLHVLIDEYQDTNQPQYQLSKLLSAHYRNLCVVGDASQAIYSWRGADYKNLLALQSDFPDLVIIRLEQNYRSTQRILTAATSIISHNTLHPVLSLWTQADIGEPLTITQYPDGQTEARAIIQTVLNQHQLHPDTPLSQYVILYRTNAQSRVFEEACLHANLPYVLVGGIKFYQRAEIKDVLSYLRYLINPQDSVAKTRLTKLGKRRLSSFDQWLSTADKTAPPLKILDKVLEITQYLHRFDEKNPEDLNRIENVKELRSVANNFHTLTEFLENIALVEADTQPGGLVTPKSRLSAPNSPDALILMTLHASKGLEFDHVFLVGLEEGLFPHSRSLLSPDELEEERRLCYVGLTRAKKTVSLSYANQRLYFGAFNHNQPSRFLAELPEDAIQSASPAPAPLITAADDTLLDRFLNDEIDIDAFLES